MKLYEYSSILARNIHHRDYALFSLLAIISPVVPEIPVGEEWIWCNFHMLYIGDIGIGKSSLLNRIAKLAPIAVYADKLTEGSIIGLYGSREIVFPLVEGAYNGVIISTEFDKTVKNKRIQGLLRRIMEKWEIQTWTRGHTRKITPNSAILAAANPRGDVIRATKLFDILVFELGLLNRFDYIKIASLSKEDIKRIAEDIGANAWVVNLSKSTKMEEIRNHIHRIHGILVNEETRPSIEVPGRFGREITKLFIERADPDNNPLENIRLLISSLKIIQLSTYFNLEERKVKENKIKATEEDLELAKMYLLTQIENLRNIYKYMSNVKESKSAKILAIYSIIKKLVTETKGPVKLSEVIRESEKEGIASENTVRRYVRILADQGHVKLWLYKTVYYVGLRNTMSPEEYFSKKQAVKTS